MSRKVTVFLLILLLSVVGLISYRLFVNNRKAAQNSAVKPVNKASVYGEIVEGKSFSDNILLTGVIEPNEIVDLKVEASGLIENISFSEGAFVKRGQVLLEINDNELQAQLTQASTMHNLSQENERRAKLLLEKEAISQEEYDIANAEYRTSAAQIQVIESQIAKTVLKAPFSGRIGLRKVSRGSYITPISDIAQLVSDDRMKITFSVPEKYINNVRIGDRVDFLLPSDSLEYAAKIYALEPALESNTRTLQIRAWIESSHKNLIPGIFVQVNFPLAEVNDAILIPAEALIPIQNGKKVFVLKEGKAKEVMVETGGRTDEDVLITKGLNIGDTVLTSGVMSLRDGSTVNVSLR